MKSKTILGSVAAALCMAIAGTASQPALGADGAHEASSGPPLVIAKQGSFYVGGRRIVAQAPAVSPLPFGGLPDATAPGQAIVDHMWVEYAIPVARKYLPVVMVHGGAHTGKTYDETPDGREGWKNIFLRAGFPVYVVDRVNRARSGFDVSANNLVRRGDAAPDMLPQMLRLTDEVNWPLFRFGPSIGNPFPGLQFPIEAMDQYLAQLVPDLDNSTPPEANTHGFEELLDKIGPAIFITHSQGVSHGFNISRARPDDVKGHIAVEAPCPTTDLSPLEAVPAVAVFGDFIDQSPPDGLWPIALESCTSFVNSINAAGGDAELLVLPDEGIFGNDHMMMMDKNNEVVAARLIRWIRENVENGGRR